MTDTGQITNSFPKNYLFPISTLRGNEKLKLLLLLIAIDPSIGGLILIGGTGTGKSQFIHAFQRFQIPLEVITECQFKCSPTRGNLCFKCEKKEKKQIRLDINKTYAPIILMPPTAPIDAIVGNLDLDLQFRSGILGQVNNGFLIIDDMHLVPQSNLNIVFNVWQSRQNLVQRQSLSLNHPSNFAILASVNSDIHEISPSVLDKFAFSYYFQKVDNIEQRIEIIDANLCDLSGGRNIELSENNLSVKNIEQAISNAQANLFRVRIPSEHLKLISNLCLKCGIQGYRADIALAAGSRALASFQGRTVVEKADILLLAPFVFNHRLQEEKHALISDILSNGGASSPFERKKELSKEKDFSHTPLRKDQSTLSRKFLEWIASILGILVGAFLVASVLVNIMLNPSIFLYIFSLLVLWGLGALFLYLYIRQYKRSREKSNTITGSSKPDISSFSKVKEFRLTAKTEEEKRGSTKEIILDIEDERSRMSRISRFLKFPQRRGMMTFSDRQRFWINLFGIFILLISLVFYTYLIFILPLEYWISLLFFLLALLTIGFIIQSLRKQRRINLVADLGASPKEKMKRLDEQGIGSHISPLGVPEEDKNSSEQYGRDLWKKLSDLDLVAENTQKDPGMQLFPYGGSTNIQNQNSKVIADALPRVYTRTGAKISTKSGKRALGITSFQSGRVIGSQSFKDYPRNIHFFATIRNSVMRQSQKGIINPKRPISIKLEDIHEKVFSRRVSATIIFVLDLSESIVNTIKTVSSSISWLSRQAYLYRDRVGIVVLKGTQGVIIQPPTSNLNLIKRKLRNLRASGSTPLAGGLQKAIELIKLDRIRSKSEIIPMIILITDGATNIPLLTDPLTGGARDTPLTEMGLDDAVEMAIQDCISLSHQIKKENIALTIFSTNIRGSELLSKIPRSQQQTISEFLTDLISSSRLFKGRSFIQLWSFTLLRAMQEITGGYLYYLSRYQSDLNLETLRIARAEMLSKIPI